MKFSELKLNDRVLEALDAMIFEECAPVQEQTIPVILDGKDLIAVAPVSYTHLRAHETRHDLVCRLLLEKKKKKRRKMR